MLLPITKQKLIITLIIVSTLYTIYWMYLKIQRTLATAPIFIRKPIDTKQPLTILKGAIPQSADGISYTLMFWMNLTDWSYKKGEWKHVLHKGESSTGNYPQPGIWISPDTNDMVIRYHTYGTIGNYKITKEKVFKSMVIDEVQCNNLQTELSIILPNYELVQDKTIGELKKIDKKFGNNGITFLVPTKKESNSHGLGASNEAIYRKNNRLMVNDNYLVRKAFIKKTYVDKNIDPLVNAPKCYYSGDEIPITIVKDIDVSLSPEEPNGVEDDTGMSSYIHNIPLKRWFHTAIVVNEYSSDIYIDGQLKSSGALENHIRQNEGDLYVTQRGGFEGMLTQLIIKTSPTTSEELLHISQMGPNVPQLPDLTSIQEKYVPKISFDIDIKTDVDSTNGPV
jgi:hypothetical protein